MSDLEKISSILSNMLMIDYIDPDIELINYGMDSICMIEFVVRVEEELGKRVQLNEVLKTPTARSMANYISQA